MVLEIRMLLFTTVDDTSDIFLKVRSLKTVRWTQEGPRRTISVVNDLLCFCQSRGGGVVEWWLWSALLGILQCAMYSVISNISVTCWVLY